MHMNFKSCNAEAVNIMHVYLNSCDLIFFNSTNNYLHDN